MITFLLSKSNILAHSTQHTAHSNLKKCLLLLIFLFMNFLPIKSYSQVDTFICDNGGFEQDFLYYIGSTTTYSSGGDNCVALGPDMLPVTYNPATIPSFRRFEIVTSGIDPLVGISRTKFGNKALLLNNRYGHTAICSPLRDVNKISKRFKVTAQNRNFTLWYAAVLENPAGHTNTQPFFSISCDLAPNDDICFNAGQLNCQQNYQDENCIFDGIDVVDWTCHRINIPENYIGSIATIEITAADCGAGAHFGYAYIDGFCEECTGSSDGSVTIYNEPFNPVTGVGVKDVTCNADTIVVCGSYTLPTICGDWFLDSIIVKGFQVNNFQLDTANKTFCFEIPSSLFVDTMCRNLYLICYFSTLTRHLYPIYSNVSTFCLNNFKKFEADIFVGDCHDNNTSENLSDDYYYVNINLTNYEDQAWTMIRELNHPYPNEYINYIVKSDFGSGNFTIGPFLIREGSWTLTINVKNCIYTYQINPPNFCPSCNKFTNTSISNIACHSNNINNGTWSFQLYIPGSGEYDLIKLPSTPILTGNYNTIYTITAGIISQECLTFELIDRATFCSAVFTICPPKPCSNNINCDINLFVKDLVCNNLEFSANVVASGGGNKCYKVFDKATNTLIEMGVWPIGGAIGPYTADIYLVVYPCSLGNINPSCFKVIYIPKPECLTPEFGAKTRHQETKDLEIITYQINENSLSIYSKLDCTKYEIFNSSGNLISSAQFKGKEHKVLFDPPPGLYFLRYKNNNNKFNIIKFIKL